MNRIPSLFRMPDFVIDELSRGDDFDFDDFGVRDYNLIANHVDPKATTTEKRATCKFCGCSDLTWKQMPNEWRLVYVSSSIQKLIGKIHACESEL